MPKSGFSPSKLILPILVLGALGAGYYYYQASQAPAKPEFAITTVARGDVIQTITATGQLDPLITVDVGSQISGLVQKLYVDFNSEVKKGQKLAEIDPATYEQRLRQARADLASAQASNKLARLNAQRTKELFDKSLVTQQELDQADATLAQSAATLQTREASVVNAEVDLARCTIFSPIDGIVMSKATEEGKTVAASLNAPVLFTIANDLAKMQITAAVAEVDIGTVKEGQSVTFTSDAFPNRTFNGRVSQVRNAPKTVSNVVTYDAIIDVDNRDLRLRPGMTANVSIIVARRDGTLRLPNAALRLRVPEGVTVKPLPEPAGAKTAQAAPGKDAPSAGTPPAASGEQRRPRGEGGGGGGRGRGMFGDLTPEQREKMREIMTEIGVDFRSGPPSEEQRAQLRKLMIERGVIAAEPAPGEAVVTTRTVYRLPGGNKNAIPEAVSIKAGITDGSSTEVIEGLTEGDVIVTNIILPGAATASRPPTQSNPFGGGGMRRP